METLGKIAEAGLVIFIILAILLVDNDTFLPSIISTAVALVCGLLAALLFEIADLQKSLHDARERNAKSQERYHNLIKSLTENRNEESNPSNNIGSDNAIGIYIEDDGTVHTVYRGSSPRNNYGLL